MSRIECDIPSLFQDNSRSQENLKNIISKKSEINLREKYGT